MKKFLAVGLVMVLAMVMVAGCCTRIDPVTKVTTKSLANCLTAAQQILCSPTDQQKAEAASILTFLTSGVAVASFVINVPITAAQVTTIFGMVQSGGCVLITDLQTALAWYDALTAAVQTKAMAGKKVMAMPPAVPALHAWVKK